VSKADENGRTKVLIAMEGVVGGTLRHIEYLLRFADPEEFDVHLAVSARRAPHAREDFRRWTEAGRQVHEVPMHREISPLGDLLALRKVLALCRAERFDVVHTHCAKAGFLGRVAARLTGARTIHTPHVFPFSHDMCEAKRLLYLGLEKLAARWTDRFVLLSEYQINLLLEHSLARPERAVVIPNGILPEEFAGVSREEARRELDLRAEDRVVLFAARLREQKAPDVMLGASRRLADTMPGLRVLIVGEGPLERQVKAELKSEALAKVVRFHGLTDRMPLYYAACDLVAMPSRAEGMPYVLLEAKAAGRPVIAALVSGMEEFIEQGCDGFLVPPDNAEALADLLAKVLRDPKGLGEAGKRAREGFRDEWRAEKSAERLFDLYRELAALKREG